MTTADGDVPTERLPLPDPDLSKLGGEMIEDRGAGMPPRLPDETADVVIDDSQTPPGLWSDRPDLLRENARRASDFPGYSRSAPGTTGAAWAGRDRLRDLHPGGLVPPVVPGRRVSDHSPHRDHLHLDLPALKRQPAPETRLTQVARVCAIIRDVLIVLLILAVLFIGTRVVSAVGDVRDPAPTVKPLSCFDPQRAADGTVYCPGT